MTGSVHQLNRQNSSTSSTTKMDKTYPSELDSSAPVNSQASIEVMPEEIHPNKDFVSKRKGTTSEHDSGMEDEHKFDDISIKDPDDAHDQSSVKSFNPGNDEGFSDSDVALESRIEKMLEAIEKVKPILDDIKKDFCDNTRVACHGEFARLLSIPLKLRYNIRYRLVAEEELLNNFYEPLPIICHIVENAKAQFKCPNPCCNHPWTSMRARILFSVSAETSGIILLKTFGQHCKKCGTYSHALWYIDEMFRVMKNFTIQFYACCYPNMLNDSLLQNAGLVRNDGQQSMPKRHNPNQRKGNMKAQHAKEFCEACLRGVCFL